MLIDKDSQLSDILVALGLVVLVWFIGLPNSISMGLTLLICLVIARNSGVKTNKAVQLALVQERRLAEDANRAKSAFLANMSHEIRTPLNGILGTMDLVLETRLDPEQREYIALAKGSAVNLLEIVNDILDFSKIEAGGVEFAYMPFTLEESLGDMLKVMSLRATDKHIEFKFHNDTGLSAALMGDPGRLRQIIVNLVGNAVKFTERGSVEVRVLSTGRTERGVSLRFSVIDTGIGISTAQLQRLFQSFAQADSSISRVYGGTGLGLAISKGLIEAMKGRIWVESKPGVGSEFFFELNFDLDRRLTPRNGPKSEPASEQVLSSLHLLVVEDNPVNRLIVSRMLAKRGYRVSEAATAMAGLELIESERPDLVLMDLQLPGMGGLEALELLRATPGRVSSTPVIALTAHVLIGDRERCLAAGMNGYVAKPFTVEALIAEIARVMGEQQISSFEVATPDPAPQRFSRALEGLDGDVDLFAEVAVVAVNSFASAAKRLDELGQTKDMAGLGALAHQLKSNWALYADAEYADLPDLLMSAVRRENEVLAIKLAAHFSLTLAETASALSAWLEQHEKVANA